MADDFKFQITESFGTLSELTGGWKTELNMVAWGDRPPKYDIRTWSPDHARMRKGVTLTREELIALKNLLASMDLE